jgi:VCBS repeat-containing protein
MSSLSPAAVLADPFEANDSLLQPTSVGSTIDWQQLWPFTALTIHHPGDRDFFLFSIETLISRPYALDLSIDNPLLDLDLHLYDASGEIIGLSVNGFAGEPESLKLQDLTPGTYILEVSVYQGEPLESHVTTAYQLQLATDGESLDNPSEISGNSSGFVFSGTPIEGQLIVTDADGLESTDIFTLALQPQHGIATIDGQSGIWSYQSHSDYHGNDAFVVAIQDRLGNATEQTIDIAVTQISLTLTSVANVVEGVVTTINPLPEKRPEQSTDNFQTFALQAALTAEQLAILQLQPPAVPIRFRVQLDQPIDQLNSTLSPEDIVLSVLAIDPSNADDKQASPAIDLRPDSYGFYEWPVFDRQSSGRGFVMATLEINAIPVADNLLEGVETGRFSIVDLSGAIFPNPDGTATQIAPNQGQLAFADPLSSTSSATFNLDVDGDGAVTALGDGLMIIRKLFGSAFAGTALTNKAMSTEATRSAEQIHTYIEGGINNGLLDVDRNGQTTALGDGLMIIRRLFGGAFEGFKLTQKAIGTESPYFGTATEYQSVAANIDALKPSTSAGTIA